MSLPTRRPCITESIEHGGEKFHITVGFDPREELIWEDDGRVGSGKPIEVFAYGPKVGTALWAMTQENAVQTSYALQRGRKPENMVKDVMRDGDENPISVIGEMYDQVRRLELEWNERTNKQVEQE